MPAHVVLIHHGRSWYLAYALNQAAAVSGSASVTLIREGGPHSVGVGAPASKHPGSVRAVEFQNRYVHMSKGDFDYELFCFLRWFYLLDYMEEKHLDAAVYLDSDVLLFTSVEEIAATFHGTDYTCGLSIPIQSFDSLRWAASGHASFWKREGLEAFCDFLLSSYTDERYLAMYRDKWSWHQRTAKPGGVTDMTALYLFSLKEKQQVANLAAVCGGGVFDHNINDSSNNEQDEYEMAGGRKSVKFIDGKPMLTRSNSDVMVRAHALHLQGGAKNFIPFYYQGEQFPARRVLDSYAALRRMGQRGKRLIGR